ncbi:hypothetical protein GGC63_004980 [Paenibacillus sp. OAS669]|nr:hypothetical protein [Paenibacillus sp. OAS669]
MDADFVCQYFWPESDVPADEQVGTKVQRHKKRERKWLFGLFTGKRKHPPLRRIK